jgi:hypothetical protein
MSKKQPRKSIPTSGWEREAWEEDIDSAVASNVNAEERRAYTHAYDRAAKLLAKGKTPAAVRAAIHREPQLREGSAEETAEQAKWRKVDNRTKEELCRIEDQAIEDAIEKRPPDETKYLRG